MIHNPILPGFNPDPCICRKGDDYYLAVSTFEWFPGIPIYHSRDLKHWELYTHVLTDDEKVDLKKLPSAKGVWAPCLTYCEAEDTFYVVYGVMNSMNARYFDVDNYLVTAKDIRDPGASRSTFIPQALTHPYSTMTMAGNTLSPWNGRQEKDMKSPAPSAWWSTMQLKKKSWDIPDACGGAVRTADASKPLI